MSEKRKRDTTDAPADRKRPKRGFTVGPANLPDGIYKRKNQKIKQNLIEKAKIRKDYAKLKKQGVVPEEEETIPQPASLQEPSTAPHPDRQELIEKEIEEPEEVKRDDRGVRERRRRPKTVPFRKEHEAAMKEQEEAEERRRAREEAQLERERKIEERDKFRRAMAKARTGGRNGQRKLGRESNVLLEKVKRMLGGS